VEKPDLTLLAQAEARKGQVLAPNSFHFIQEEEIFKAIDEEKNLLVVADQDISNLAAH
jgi:hypothetical protein